MNIYIYIYNCIFRLFFLQFLAVGLDIMDPDLRCRPGP